MATTRTSAPRTRTAAASSGTTTRKPTHKSTVEKASGAVTSSAGTFFGTVKKSPIASAAIAAGVAGAGALIWANRSQIAEQAGAIGERASEIGGRIGERASAVGEKISEKYAAATGAATKSQQEFAEETPSLKQSSDPMLAEQGKVGSISY